MFIAESDNAPIALFRNRALPQPSTLAGYAYLVNVFALQTVLPYQLHAASTTQSEVRTLDWIIHPLRRRPRDTLLRHLIFALKYEGVNLLLLKQIFSKMGQNPLLSGINDRPNSTYIRRLCFFYEWLLDEDLDITATIGGSYVDAVDTKLQYATTESENEPKWRVRDNLPGSSGFCPLVARTKKLDAHMASDFPSLAEQAIRDVPETLLNRAASFLLLNDSKASFEIERERPSKDRAARWASVIARAGEVSLSTQGLEDLQKSLIEDDRFVQMGLRDDAGFVGEHSPLGEPRPDHISANAHDLPDLVESLVKAERVNENYAYDAVLSATAISFGFVYIHPFEDGNGRLHRYLIHNVLSARGYFPDLVILPISVAILADLVSYRQTLETLSRPLLTVVDWQPTDRGNVRVQNETGDYYRYFDATPHAEFLFDCIARTIQKELPDELRFLSARDIFHRQVTQIVDMPERLLDVLFQMLRQNDGTFSRRMRTREFEAMTNQEAAEIEAIFAASTN